MSNALEFSTPVSPTLLGKVNRNIRKFRIVQYDPDGEGLLPMVLGTYAVDLTTGQPLTTPQNPAPNNFNTVVTAASGATLITIFADSTQWRLYRLWASLSVAGKLTLKFGTSNIATFDIGTASQVYFFDFGPSGLSTNDLLLGPPTAPLANLNESHTGGGTLDAFLLFNLDG